MAPPIISSRTSKLSTSSRNIENNKNKDTNLSATTNNNHFPSPTLSKTSLEVIERLRNYKIPPDPCKLLSSSLFVLNYQDETDKFVCCFLLNFRLYIYFDFS